MTRLLLLIAALQVAWADEPQPTAAETAAEAARLSEEIVRLAGRSAWGGVERQFNTLQDLATPTAKDYIYGAHAARDRGDVAQTRERLQAAFDLDPSQPDRDIIDWLWDIDTHYGEAELFIDKPKRAMLSVEAMPFDPVQRKAVEFAIEQVNETGAFKGLLPLGHYKFSRTDFEIVAEERVHIELILARKRKHSPEP